MTEPRDHFPAWVNRRLLADLSARLGTADLLQWIEERTAGLARLGWRKGRVALSRELLESAGIVGVAYDPLVEGLAEMRPAEGGHYRVKVRGFPSAVQHRFSVAHELAHTFWFAPDLPARALSPWQSQLASDPTIEWLCNRAAAALLVPRGLLEHGIRHFGSRIDADPPRLDLLWDFATQYQVPLQMLARRWFHEILAWPLNLVCLRPASEAVMIVEWHARNGVGRTKARPLYSKRVPAAAVPASEAGATERTSLDGRWLTFVAQAREIKRLKSFKHLPSANDIDGLVARPNDFVSPQVIVAFRD
jgi:hypothetical protein